MGDKLDPSLAEFEGKRWQGTTGPNRSLSGQVHAANPTPLFNLDAFDIPVGIDLETDHGLDGTLQLAQGGLQPVLSHPLLHLPHIPGIHRFLAGSRTDGDSLTSPKAGSRAWIDIPGPTTARIRRLRDRPRTRSLSLGGGRVSFRGAFLFKDLLADGLGFLSRGRSHHLGTRDNGRLVHSGAAVRFGRESDRDKIILLSSAGTRSDHDRIAGRQKIDGEGEYQEQGGVTHHGSEQR